VMVRRRRRRCRQVRHQMMISTEDTVPVNIGSSQSTVITVSLISHLR
jgi:hypothetical protein